MGVGVIWDQTAFGTLAIPAKAGIQSVVGALPVACGIDSRFRGNDCSWERPCLANDTGTVGCNRLSGDGSPRYG